MEETIVLRLKGGPHERQSFVSMALFENQWPLPDILPGVFVGGIYQKVNESKLTEQQARHPNVMRGVEYRWVETEKQDA